MKVVFDEQIFSVNKYGGISRYFAEIYGGIKNTSGNSAVIASKFSDNVYLNDIFKQNPEFNTSKIVNKSGNSLITHSYNRLKSIATAIKGDYDVFVPTYINPYFINYIGKKPFVFTVHDMIPELFKNYDLQNDHITKLKKICMYGCSKIIAISESTKSDIIKLYPDLHNKIEVIYHGYRRVEPVSPYTEGFVSMYGNYLLFVGTRTFYKNFIFMVKAIGALLKKENIKLVCVGGGGFTVEEMKLFTDIGISELCFQVTATDEELNALYKSARLFVFPSEYEGFGLPILEAFSNDCPIVLAENSCMKEIAVDAGLYFDSHNGEKLLFQCEKILNDEELRNRIVLRGKIRLQDFSWAKTVRDTINVYESVS